MTVVSQADAYADAALLERSLAHCGEDVIVRETHCSIVFLAGDRAYKLRKPVQFDFVDLRSTAARAHACRREVELNATLAPGVALGVRAVVPCEGENGYTLGRADDPRAIDHVVEMRRFDEADTMRALLQRGTLTTEQSRAVGARVARFHRDEAPRRHRIDYRALVNRNFEALLPLAEDLLPVGERLALQRFAAAFLLEWAAVLDTRAATGSVVDGHGDLRAEHVLFEPDNLLIVDRLEFDALRVVDVADELGFLLMELAELTGTQAAGDAVLGGYREAGGAAQPEALLAFFGAYRAQVRAKVALLRATQPGVDPHAQRAHAQQLLGLSRRLGWRARGPLLLLVTGPPAAGKSTLAAALGRASGLPVLSSDAIRREHGGQPPDYGPGVRAAVYAELGRRARRERAVIVDATFGDVQQQRAFCAQLDGGAAGVSHIVECYAPADLRVARADLRQLRGDTHSDAGTLVARQLGERFVAMDAAAADAHLAVDTRAPLTSQVDEVASWLDSLLAAGRSA